MPHYSQKLVGETLDKKKPTKSLSGAKLLADIHDMLKILEKGDPPLHARMKKELTKILRQYQKDIQIKWKKH